MQTTKKAEGETLHQNYSQTAKKTIKKTFFTIAIVITALCLLFVVAPFALGIIFMGGGTLFAPNLSRIQADFQKNQESLNVVAKYLINSNFDHAMIRKTSNSDHSSRIVMSVAGNRILVSDEAVSGVIHSLFQNGFSSISKDESVIVFQRWSNLSSGRGIVYSIDGTTPTSDTILSFLVEIEPLPQDSWYFYVDDFDLWRMRYR